MDIVVAGTKFVARIVWLGILWGGEAFRLVFSRDGLLYFTLTVMLLGFAVYAFRTLSRGRAMDTILGFVGLLILGILLANWKVSTSVADLKAVWDVHQPALSATPSDNLLANRIEKFRKIKVIVTNNNPNWAPKAEEYEKKIEKWVNVRFTKVTKTVLPGWAFLSHAVAGHIVYSLVRIGIELDKSGAVKELFYNKLWDSYLGSLAALSAFQVPVQIQQMFTDWMEMCYFPYIGSVYNANFTGKPVTDAMELGSLIRNFSVLPDPFGSIGGPGSYSRKPVENLKGYVPPPSEVNAGYVCVADSKGILSCIPAKNLPAVTPAYTPVGGDSVMYKMIQVKTCGELYQALSASIKDYLQRFGELERLFAETNPKYASLVSEAVSYVVRDSGDPVDGFFLGVGGYMTENFLTSTESGFLLNIPGESHPYASFVGKAVGKVIGVIQPLWTSLAAAEKHYVVYRVAFIVQAMFLGITYVLIPFVIWGLLLFGVPDPATGFKRLMDYFLSVLWIYSWWLPWLFGKVTVDLLVGPSPAMSLGWIFAADMAFIIVGPMLTGGFILGARAAATVVLSGVAAGTATVFTGFISGMFRSVAEAGIAAAASGI